MGVNSMLAMMVFLMAMIDNLPPSEKLPLAGVYYGGCLVVVTMNISFSVYVLSLSHAGERDHQVPPWLRSATVMCSRIVRMRVPTVVVKAWHLDAQNLKAKKDSVQPHSSGGDDSDDDTLTENTMQVRVIKLKPNYCAEGADMLKDPYQRRSLQALEGIQHLLSKEASVHRSHTKKSSLMQEWKYISRAMDRLLFYIFCGGTLLFNAIILSQSPFGVKFEYCSRGAGMCTESGSSQPAEPQPHL
nr:neuronal acetylcholine receptor subunit alpha-10-like [Procambarus clarkii]